MALNSKYLDSESHIQWRHNQLNFSFSIFSLVINLLLCSINPYDQHWKIFPCGGSRLNSYESCHRLNECILATNWVKSLLNFTRLVVAEQELVDTLSISALQLAVGADGLICVKVGSNAPWLGQLITVVDLEYNCKMIQFMGSGCGSVGKVVVRIPEICGSKPVIDNKINGHIYCWNNCRKDENKQKRPGTAHLFL